MSKKKLCKHWDSPPELGSVVSRSLVKLIKEKPGIGWIRGDKGVGEEVLRENLELQRKNQELASKLDSLIVQPPPKTEHLAQGEDKISINYSYVEWDEGFNRKTYKDTCEITWNQIFGLMAPILIEEAPEHGMKKCLNEYVEKTEYLKIADESLRNDFGTIFNEDFQTIKIQLRALGLIAKSQKKKPPSDRETYWTLTPYGDQVMTNLRAIKRPS